MHVNKTSCFKRDDSEAVSYTHLDVYKRQEFFRFPCIMDMNYYTIEEQEAALKTGEALFIELQEAEGKSRDREYAGRIVDLSGGGIRFRTDQKLRENQYVLFEIHLQNENLDKQYYICLLYTSFQETLEKLKEHFPKKQD